MSNGIGNTDLLRCRGSQGVVGAPGSKSMNSYIYFKCLAIALFHAGYILLRLLIIYIQFTLKGESHDRYTRQAE